MGASGWDYVVPYQADITRALLDLQRQVFDDGEYWKGYGEKWATSSLEELVALKETESFWAEGTHSILDIDRIIDPGALDEPGAIGALPGDEARDLLGSDRPSRQDYDRVLDDLLMDLDVPRWSGRYVILYEDGQPAEIAFWGCSGD